jgi:hypothetical protein
MFNRLPLRRPIADPDPHLFLDVPFGHGTTRRSLELGVVMSNQSMDAILKFAFAPKLCFCFCELLWFWKWRIFTNFSVTFHQWMKMHP